MAMMDDIESFLVTSGVTELSLREIRREFPRWERRLLDQGVTSVPQNPLVAKNQMETKAANLLTLWLKQSRPKAVRREFRGSDEHDLRNLTRTRPYKP